MPADSQDTYRSVSASMMNRDSRANSLNKFRIFTRDKDKNIFGATSQGVSRLTASNQNTLDGGIYYYPYNIANTASVKGIIDESIGLEIGANDYPGNLYRTFYHTNPEDTLVQYTNDLATPYPHNAPVFPFSFHV